MMDYYKITEDLGRLAIDYLRGIESTFEHFHLHDLAKYQQSIAEKYKKSLRENKEEISRMDPPPELRDFHKVFSTAYHHLDKSCEIFSYPYEPQDFIPCIRSSYHEICLARYYLYQLRLQIPGFETFWITEDEIHNLKKIEAEPDPSLNMPVGLLYRDWEPTPPRYALYIPEYYNHHQKWPMIIALHGGGGNDTEFIWLWLKHAKSKGYLLAAPKSLDLTWTPKDIHMVLTMIQEIQQIYNINEKGIFLTGVSDGGTFTYEVGLRKPEIFRAIAPVSAALMPWHDFEKAKDLPVYILHGALDRIIPVTFARQAKDLLEGFGYHLVYRELPNWGHAYPFSEIGNICGFFNTIC